MVEAVKLRAEGNFGTPDAHGIAWRPQAGPQSDACAAANFCEELFYGGAVYGGKTDFLLGDFASDIHQGPAWTGVLFRQTAPELEDIIERSHEIFPYLGGHFLVGKNTWRFKSGALLRFRHMESENDFQRYMGWNLSWLGFDELPNWASMRAYHNMKSRLRGPAVDKRIRATGNPGGRCHAEIRDYFQIGSHPHGYFPIRSHKANTTRMFIPAKVRDNVIGLSQDPGYMARLEGLGDPELVRAWKEGDWNAIVGAYFAMYSRQACEVEPFAIPEGWGVFTGGDYGEENPCWWGIAAVDYDNDVWIVDEYHRAGAGGADHARGIRAMVDNCPFIRDAQPRMHLAPADMWTSRKPGEASQAMAPQDSFTKQGLHLTRANMERVNGWRNLKDLLYPQLNITSLKLRPRIHFFRGRTEELQSSLASVQRDPNNAEDVLKGGNDHPADGLRYIINHVYKPRQLPAAPAAIGSGELLLETISKLGQESRTRYG